jgi:hypothetical protein
MSTTAAEPMAIPAIAPPPSLFELETGAADVDVAAAEEVVDVVDDEDEDERVDVADEGAAVDDRVELLRPPGSRSAILRVSNSSHKT